MNEYLRKFRDGGYGVFQFASVLQDFKERTRLRHVYAYAVPTDEAIRALVRLSPIVEIGAGRGYWAKLIAEAGGGIRAFDDFSWKKLHSDDATAPRPEHPWYPVERGGPEAVGLAPEARTLLLVWPPYDDPMAADALARFEGDVVAYVGEGYGGCTADDAFHAALDARWERSGMIDLPSFWRLNDDLRIYERKRNG